MKKLICGITLLMTLSIAIPTHAHPGRLDKNGGHNVNKTGHGYPVGSYHYHIGDDREIAYDEQGNIIPKIGETPAQPVTPKPTPKPTPTPAPTPTPSPVPKQAENTPATNTANQIAVVVDGETIKFDQPPENINGRVMVPIRYVVEKMGCAVEWDGNTETVYINEPNIPIQKTAVKTNNINVFVNNDIIVFTDQQPINKSGRILIPVRFVTERLGYTVEWDSPAQIVNIYKTIGNESISEQTQYKVLRVVDGDTFEINYNGTTEKIRLIGIDTPESVHPDDDKNVEYGKIASAFTSDYLLNKMVTLEFDVQERDQYGRLLAYVWVDGKMFNEILLESGHAKIATFPPNVKYVDNFKTIQDTARAKGVGVWAYEDVQ